ncbi:ribosomal protein S18 [Patescibacteria group bacterium]|nr:ribosomal protein S18 [Patescibacteria group bacterium]
MLDAALQEKERQDTLSALEKEIKGCILKKDEIGLKQTAYDLERKRGNNNFYFYSYYLEAENENLDAIKKQLLYNKAVARYFIYKMRETEEFFMFEDLQKILNTALEGREEKKTGQKVDFFMDKANKKYLVWKALPVLKKYITRFGSIKPRKYTKNKVLIQKKVKQAIIRAREIGLLEYIK